MMFYLDAGFLDSVFFLRILLRAHAPRKSAPCGDLLRQWDHPSRYPAHDSNPSTLLLSWYEM